MYSLKPVVFENDSARSTDGAHAVVIMRSVMRAVCEVKTIAVILSECVNFWSVYSFQERLSNEGIDAFDDSVFVSDVEGDPT